MVALDFAQRSLMLPGYAIREPVRDRVADYYKVLNVNKDASDAEIKSSYRKLALKYHPDRNQGNKESEETFKKISEAYAVLSDPQKKKQYDMVGDAGFHQKYSTEDIFRGTDFSSIFNEFGFRGGPGGGRSGASSFEDLFGSLFGGAGGGFPGGGQRYQQRAPEKGQDVEYPLQVGFMEAYNGGERQISFRLSDGTARDLTVKIPAGIREGTKLRVAGRGAPSQNGGAAGDLYVIIQIAAHHQYQRVNDDIETPLKLKISEALLGSEAQVETPQGFKKIKVPAGVAAGTKIRLKGLGFPSTAGSKTRGDLYAIVTLSVPEKLSKQQKEAVEALAAIGL
jgi:curved DNA-binding protein